MLMKINHSGKRYLLDTAQVEPIELRQALEFVHEFPIGTQEFRSPHTTYKVIVEEGNLYLHQHHIEELEECDLNSTVLIEADIKEVERN